MSRSLNCRLFTDSYRLALPENLFFMKNEKIKDKLIPEYKKYTTYPQIYIYIDVCIVLFSLNLM